MLRRTAKIADRSRAIKKNDYERPQMSGGRRLPCHPERSSVGGRPASPVFRCLPVGTGSPPLSPRAQSRGERHRYPTKSEASGGCTYRVPIFKPDLLLHKKLDPAGHRRFLSPRTQMAEKSIEYDCRVPLIHGGKRISHCKRRATSLFFLEFGKQEILFW